MNFAETGSVRHILIGFLLAVSLAVAGCSDKSTSPTNPTPGPTDLTGTWSGQVSFAGVSARMTWTLTQTNTSVSGPALVVLPTGTVLLNGFVTGTLNGSSLPYALSVGPGGIPSQPSCVGQLTGTMTVTAGTPATLSGPTSVASSSCTSPFSGATLTLTKQ